MTAMLGMGKHVTTNHYLCRSPTVANGDAPVTPELTTRCISR